MDTFVVSVCPLDPDSSDFGDVCALYAPFLHQLTMQSSLFERWCPVLVVVCVGANYARVQATVGVGTVLIWDFGVAYTGGGGTFFWYRASRASTALSKHGSPCYRCFDDLQGACARGGGGMVIQSREKRCRCPIRGTASRWSRKSNLQLSALLWMCFEHFTGGANHPWHHF